MALYVELDALASNGEQYWYDQYTEGEPRIAAVKSVTTSSLATGLTGLRYGSFVIEPSSTTIAAYELLLQPVASLVEGTSTFINNGNITSSSGVVQFPDSETIAAGVRYVDPCAAVQYGSVTVIVNGRLKWQSEDVNAESWTKLSTNSESWTKVN